MAFLPAQVAQLLVLARTPLLPPCSTVLSPPMESCRVRPAHVPARLCPAFLSWSPSYLSRGSWLPMAPSLSSRPSSCASLSPARELSISLRTAASPLPGRGLLQLAGALCRACCFPGRGSRCSSPWPSSPQRRGFPIPSSRAREFSLSGLNSCRVIDLAKCVRHLVLCR
jgi:hypothetical protein